MLVLKFGGSSVAQAERIVGVGEIVQRRLRQGENIRAIVFSAFGGVTDKLLELSNAASLGDDSYKAGLSGLIERHHEVVDQLFPTEAAVGVRSELSGLFNDLSQLLQGVYLVMEATPRTMDYVLSFGERLSALIIARYFNHRDIACQYLDARDIIKTDKQFGAAQVDFNLTFDRIRRYFGEHGELQIVTGFISSARGGLTTTLGRGGSDYTASLLATALSAKTLEIWTDVDGVLTADPRKVPKAFTLPQMSYAEAVEMSHFGAKVIYPPTILPVMRAGIPIYIKNTFNPDIEGTLIIADAGSADRAVKGISSISNIALLTLQGSGMFGVPGIAARLFESLAGAGINVILITQGSSENAITFAIQPTATARAKKVLEMAFEQEMTRGTIDPVKVENCLSVIAIIGENMRYRPGVAGKMLTALGNNGINAVAIAQGSSELNISVVINEENERKALSVLHEAFFLSDTKVLNLFVVGVGLIGGTLLTQLEQQADFLKRNRSIEIRVVGLANRSKMLLDPDGVTLSEWREVLTTKGRPTDIDQFVSCIISLNLPNSVFVDNTADMLVAGQYRKLLDAAISISTPNKIATSGAAHEYLELLALSKRKNVYYGYETNVGAGLPVISTLRNLIDSGDQVLRIEGVLSGSLSFIFNHFDENLSFSGAVERAGELGFTEPDPRIDLTGTDVKRKILILARETGLCMEADDVEVEQILPKHCLNAKTVKEFRKELKLADPYFEALRQRAASKGNRLRMLAVLDGTKATIALREVGTESPFFFLSGSDNMIVFTTARYQARPLVVQGPGAGAEVTAAGVFAEIIHIANLL